MRNALWIVLICMCGLSYAETKVVDRIYAQVNEDIITLSDINRKMELVRRELAEQFTGDELENAVKEEKGKVLDVLVEEKLLVQKAIELGIDADVEPKVSAEIQNIMKRYNIDSMDAFEEALEKQGNNLRDFREQIRNQIMADDIVHMFVRSRITIMQNEVERYYNQHAAEYATPEELSLSEIIVTVKAAGSEESAASRARDLCDQVKKGASFTSLASQFSDGTTANIGGNIGSNLLEKWHPDIVKAVAGLDTGDISEPQKIEGGYVIYRVDSRKPSIVPPLEEIENDIKDRIFRSKYRPEYDRFIERLKEDAYIQIHPESE